MYFDDALLEDTSRTHFDDVLLEDRPSKRCARTALYRLHRSDGELLYVGITGDLRNRFRVHRCQTKWWGEVDEARTEVQWFSSRPRARSWEARAIRTEKPPRNIRP
jgi:predicted GIY-YIG superfamily endonuclease